MIIRFLALTLLLVTLQCSGQEGPSNVPLIEALREGDLPKAREILHSGARLNVRDNYGSTPLIQAIRSGHTEFAEELLGAGADPRLTASNKDTSLMMAAWECNVLISRKLLAAGVAVNAVDAEGETALMFASQTCKDGVMFQLLLDAGADPNARTVKNSTALMWAAHGGNWAAAEKLLSSGADASAADDDANTAESMACGRQVGRTPDHDRVCSLLKERSQKK